MRYISCKLDDLKKIVLPIGYEGENEHTRVQVDASEVFKEYPEAVPTLKVHGPTGAIYPAEVTRDGKNVIWDIKASDCAADGSGEAQFTFTLNNVIVKSCIAKIKVYRSIVGNGPAPDPVKDWVDNAEEVLDDLAAMDNIAKTAEAGDVGKALSPKTVENGVVTEWQYIEPGGGTEDYTDLENKPQIGGVELSGDKSLHDLGIAAESAIPDVSGKANLTVVAPAFDQATANDAGSFVTHEGVVYLLPDGHTAGTTWANTSKTATNIGAQLAGVLNEIAGLQEDIVEAVDDWLDEHPEATTTVEDGSITKDKLAQSVVNETNINKAGSETFTNYGTFVNGNLASGVVYTNVKYRVTTNTIMTFARALKITVEDGFRFLWHMFVNGSYSTNSDWKTGTVTIPANTSFKILIARVTEDSSEVADISVFLSKVVFNTVIQDEIDTLSESMTNLDTEIDQKTDFVEFITDPNFEDTTNIVSDTTWQEGYYRSTAGNATSSQYTTNYICSDFIAVNPGEKYRLYVSGAATVLVEYYSNAKNDGTEVSLGSIAANGHVDITVPDGKTFIALNCLMNHSNKVNVIHRLTQYDNEKSICFPRLVYGTQEWIGKKIVNMGDSIFANGLPSEDISTFINKKTGATVYNCAFGGCRMGYHTASQFDAFSMYKLADAIATNTWTEQDAALSGENIPDYYATTLARLKGIDFTEVDILTISYGTNDFAGGLRIGGDDKYSTDWALKYSIETILTAYPNLRIFVCMPMYRVWLNASYEFDEDSNTKEVTSWVGGGSTYKLTDFVEAERDVCKKTQTPVIDTYFDLGINKWNWTEYFPSTDGTHHDIAGRKLISDYVCSQIW